MSEKEPETISKEETSEKRIDAIEEGIKVLLQSQSVSNKKLKELTEAMQGPRPVLSDQPAPAPQKSEPKADLMNSPLVQMMMAKAMKDDDGPAPSADYESFKNNLANYAVNKVINKTFGRAQNQVKQGLTRM